MAVNFAQKINYLYFDNIFGILKLNANVDVSINYRRLPWRAKCHNRI